MATKRVPGWQAAVSRLNRVASAGGPWESPAGAGSARQPPPERAAGGWWTEFSKAFLLFLGIMEVMVFSKTKKKIVLRARELVLMNVLLTCLLVGTLFSIFCSFRSSFKEMEENL